MSDLIERAYSMYVSGPTIPSCQLCKELADEIERLTTEASCAAHNAAEYHDIIRGQRKRIAKLEAALQKHDPESMGCPGCGGQFDSITRLCIECGSPVDSEVEK